MIESMRIRGLGVIELAELELAEGFTAITGETGAGKTMLLNGLDLVRGSRADASLVGAQRTEVDVVLRLPANSAARERTEEAGGLVEDDLLVLARTVTPEGRSRAYLGGRAVPAAVLGEVCAELVAVHGQHNARRLLKPSYQRRALDQFGGDRAATAYESYRATWQALVEARERLTAITTQARERALEAEGLRVGIAAIDSIAPTVGEDDALRVESQRLVHAESLQAATAGAHQAIWGRDDASGVHDAVAGAAHILTAVREYDDRLGKTGDVLTEVAATLADVAGDLSSHLERLDADPRRLETVQQRRAELAKLTRVYGETVAGVLDWRAAGAARLTELEGDEAGSAVLTQRVATLEGVLDADGVRLTAVRVAAADRLADAVSMELDGLSMAARFGVGVSSDLPGPHGCDDVEFTLIDGAVGKRPVSSGASGGELSRMMLALEVVLAGDAREATLVFDEIDAGIGGRTALEIGRRLAALARTGQVVVVTHLAQVAAFADRQIVIERAADEPISEVRTVSGDDRTAELARMLSGSNSPAALEHAAELMTQVAAPARSRSAKGRKSV